VRALAGAAMPGELRPAKGVHAVIARARVHADAAVALQADDGRDMFLCPWEGVHLIGTTDVFSDEVDAPVVTQAELQYVLAAANRAFPRARLKPADVISVYAGVRPLVADAQATTPPSRVSREHRITQDASGLLSVAGGKLTTYRAMAEQIVDRVVAALPRTRANALSVCHTTTRPLRDDGFERAALAGELVQRFGLAEAVCERLIEAWGGAAPALLAAAPSEQREPIAGSRYLHAEVAWSIRHECAASLCDVLERRLRVAVTVAGQGLAELTQIARIAAEAAGWSDAQMALEIERYRALVERRYRVQP
jgi:glycerol-3-phosphate dehydrogenase